MRPERDDDWPNEETDKPEFTDDRDFYKVKKIIHGWLGAVLRFLRSSDMRYLPVQGICESPSGK
jgi:hypothetical protein